jgi:hypothetical protein
MSACYRDKHKRQRTEVAKVEVFDCHLAQFVTAALVAVLDIPGRILWQEHDLTA